MRLADFEEMESTDQVSVGVGYHYKAPNGPMVECHVDDHPSFQDKLSHLEFGGNLSVRKPPNEKPLISFGQDECIFKQFLFSCKTWTAPDGTKALIPKDEGLGVMISAICSREFGFGFELTPEQLLLVNAARDGKKYSDEEAAKAVNGNPNKLALTKSPFVIEFEYGQDNQGYWDYNQMVTQLEDCVDDVDSSKDYYSAIYD